ncbi:MAG TPA: putative 2OG-Fe(II) oxygenase [Casimicrobiaceae bacterium]|nr:putative 2OG-Fe(II) oxygenase [Casimicrobiaceae bacterium]
MTLQQLDSGAGEQAALPPAIRVGDVELPAWPEHQVVEPLSARVMGSTRFADLEAFHPALIAAVLAAESDPRWRSVLVLQKPGARDRAVFRGGCGTKVRKIPEWGNPAASLIHARALMLAHRTLSRRPVYTDDSWASVYRAGDYCMPHSHLRSDVSIVYMLDPGDDDPDEPMAGKLSFADPRIDACCPDEPARVTRHMIPEMTPGTMLIFSSDYLHSVNPYRGRRPRITLSWNVTLKPLAGRPGEGWM